MAKIPVVIVNELKVWEGELLFYESSEFIENGFCPLAHENYELIDVPCYTTSRHLGVIARESGLFMSAICAACSISDNWVIFP